MPAGLAAFEVPGTEVAGLGSWTLLYTGQSGVVRVPRVSNYFTERGLTRKLGGQSLHMSLAALFAGAPDPRVSTTPKQPTVESVVLASLSIALEFRLRDMHLSVVQAETPACTCPGPHSVDCRCFGCSERALLRRNPVMQPTAGWPVGARPLLNSVWT